MNFSREVNFLFFEIITFYILKFDEIVHFLYNNFLKYISCVYKFTFEKSSYF